MVIDVSTNRLDAWFIRDDATTNDTFTILKYVASHELTIMVDGAGEVFPTGGVFSANTEVTLTATPSNFYIFGHWTGDLNKTGNPSSILLDFSKTVTAVFDPILVTNEVPQWWLNQYGISLTDQEALLDWDSDGVPTWQEYIADTLPNNSTSFFRIKHITNDVNALIQYDSSSQRVYSLMYSDDLGTGTWAAVPGESSIQGSGLNDSKSDANPSPHRVYRVDVELQNTP